jgi:hypothetical protein
VGRAEQQTLGIVHPPKVIMDLVHVLTRPEEPDHSSEAND